MLVYMQKISYMFYPTKGTIVIISEHSEQQADCVTLVTCKFPRVGARQSESIFSD